MYFRTRIEKHRFVVYGSGNLSTGFQPYRDQDYQPQLDLAAATATRSSRWAQSMSTTFSPNLKFSALYQHTDARLDFARPFLVATAYNDRDEHVATAKLEYSPASSLQVFTKGYLHSWRSPHYTCRLDNGVVGMPGAVTVVDDAEVSGVTKATWA